MPSTYNNADQAYILPERGINDAQKVGFLQNQRQMNEQRDQRLYEKQQQSQWKNLNLIQDDLNFDKYKTGEQAIDGYAQTELQKIQKDALANHITDEPAQLEFWLQQQLQPLGQWHNMALGTYKKLDQSLKDLNTQYPNIDYTKARDLVLNKFQNDFLDVGENGEISRKNTDQIKPTDYAGLLQQPQVLGAINNDQTDFNKFFYDVPKTSIGDKQYTNKQGHVKEYGWSGMMPQGIGELVTDEDNKPTSVRLKSDIIPSMTDANGQPMRTLPDDIYQQLKGNPKAYSAALGKWYNSPEREKAERAYMQQVKQPLTPDVEDMLFKSYLYNEGNKLVSHDLKTEEKTATPKPPHITINNGSNSNSPNINDVYGEIISKIKDPNRPHHTVPLNELSATAQSYILKYANNLLGDGSKVGQADIYVGANDKGDTVIFNAEDNSVIAPIDFKDINLPANNSVRQRQQVLQTAPRQTKPKSSSNKIKVDY